MLRLLNIELCDNYSNQTVFNFEIIVLRHCLLFTLHLSNHVKSAIPFGCTWLSWYMPRLGIQDTDTLLFHCIPKLI